MIDLRLGDCRDVLKTLPDSSVDAIVCDPPSSINFMSCKWDHNRGGRTQWVAWLAEIMAECLRVARPGAHALVWSLPRTSHWTGTAIEDAGWAIQDRIAHLNGQGYPKGKHLLKPSCEDWWLATKPGGAKWLGVDACRIGTTVETWPSSRSYAPGQMQPGGKGKTESTGPIPAGRWPANVCLSHHELCECVGVKRVKTGTHVGHNRNGADKPGGYDGGWHKDTRDVGYADPDGRETVADWRCHPDCPVKMLDDQAGERKSGTWKGQMTGATQTADAKIYGKKEARPYYWQGDSGGASRFFFVAKASRSERNRGLEGMPERVIHEDKWATKDRRSGMAKNPRPREPRPETNHHPTVKSLALMRWLCRLACPPGGLILDPFMGSGSTGVACQAEGFGFVGIEQDADYFAIAERRLAAAQAEHPLFAEARP